MRDTSLNDEAREKAIQGFSINLFGSFFSILIRSIAALLSAALPIYISDKLGFVVAENVTEFLSRWDVIIILSLVICTGWYFKNKLWPSR
jgi:hypothetical protein